MKIVIDIPDNEYELLQRGTTIGSGVDADSCLRYYILGGTVLPKGHGNLVDADKVILGLVYGKHIDNAKCGEITKIFDNAVVIPADKGE